MADNVEELLKDLGSKLENPPSNKDSLLKLLKQGAIYLSDIDQSPSNSFLELIAPFMNSIVKPELLGNQDKDVKLLIATCACEITRITAPNPPYSDEVLKDVFHLIVDTFDGLGDDCSPSFGRRVAILETLAKYRSCVVMLDLECYDLVKQLFRTFLNVASEDHQEHVINSMQAIMIVLIEESEDVREDLLLVILSALGRKRHNISNAARKLAMKLIEQCAGKFEAGIKQFVTASASRDNKLVNCQIDYHEVIYDVYRCAPQILSGAIPFLTGELLTDQLDIRLKAVRLVGHLFAHPGSSVVDIFQPVFSEFLKRLTDRVVSVRMSVLDHIKECLLSDPFRPDSPVIVAALCDRLLDYDENVRKQVVDVICDVACHEIESIPNESIKLVAERLRDKSLLVKKYTIEKLVELYRVYCTKSSEGSITLGRFEWIPGKVFRCFYDKDFRSDAIEPIVWNSLFPHTFSAQDRVKHWVRFFTLFDKVEVKAFERMLEQKQRIQQEMQRYLSLRQNLLDGDASEVHKKILLCFRYMSRLFTDPLKAEDSFQKFDQLKDANIWKIMTSLLDPSLSFHQACDTRDELLKLLGTNHKLHDFFSTLSVKCSFLLVNKEHVKEFLSLATKNKSEENLHLTQSCMDILVIVAQNCPLLFCGAEEELVNLLKDENERLKEGALHILAKAGGTIRDQLPVSTSSMDLILERLCLEGSRRQAKYAVHALAAITKDDGLKSLSVLYKRLVDMLVEYRNLPAILQSLGCIAQTATPVFETRENEIADFIRRKILLDNNKITDNAELCWGDRSETCLLKIYGLKTLVKSYMPVKDAQLRPGIDDLFQLLRDVLTYGEVSKDLASSSVDKAHLRLAVAKSILRLSKLWDREIPVDLFQLTLKTTEIDFPEGRKEFLDKVHQYIKDRHLDPKYACVFLLEAPGIKQVQYEEEKQNLSDIIQMCHQTKNRQYGVQSDVNPQTAYPENILPYLVHAFAHQTSPDVNDCKNVKAYEPVYRKLHLFISLLVPKDEDESKEKETIFTILSILQSIRNSEDVVDAEKTKNSHAISDLGMLIIKNFWKEDIQGEFTPVPLPATLYKFFGNDEGQKYCGNGGNIWLADENALDYFKSIKLETHLTGTRDLEEHEIGEDSELEGKEVPLGEMIKRLRCQVSKDKKVKDGKSQSSKMENSVGGVDILKMVREINMDNCSPDKFESSNGHKSSQSQLEKLEEKHGTRERESSDISNVPIPKRRRSISSPSTNKDSPKLSKSNSKGSGHQSTSTSGEKKPSKKLSKIADSVVSRIDKIKSSLGKLKAKSLCSFNNGRNHTDQVECDEYTIQSDITDKNDTRKTETSVKSFAAVLKKRKIGISGLTKCTTKDSSFDKEELIGSRIRVWWPMDKQYYEGTIKSYDALKGKHVIVYEDGDVEVLRLDKERWDLVASKKKLKYSKASTSSNSTAVRKDRQSKSMPPKKKASTKQRDNGSSGISDPHSPIPLAFYSTNEGDSSENSTAKGSNLEGSEDEGVSASEGDEGEKRKGGARGEEEKVASETESEGGEAEARQGESMELCEDEPLSRWKHKVGKLAARGAA